MCGNKLGEYSQIPKFTDLKIWLWDGIESLMTLGEGEFKMPIDACISHPTAEMSMVVMARGLNF